MFDVTTDDGTDETDEVELGGFHRAPYVPDDAPVGHILRAARERAGYSLSDVAEVLRIRRVFIEAIEDGRFEDLPGTTYAHGFVRSYAEVLELDADELVRRFKDEVRGLNRATQLVFPTPEPEGRMPGAALLLIAVVLAGLAYGSWYYASSTDRQLTDLLPDLPERWTAWLNDDPADAAMTDEEAEGPRHQPSAARAQPPSDDMAMPAPAPAASGTAEPEAVPAEPAADTVADAPAEEPVAPQVAAARLPADAAPADAVPTGGTTPSVDSEAPQPPQPPEAFAARAGGTEPADARVVIRATDISWVQVRDPSGRVVMTRVLQPGDSYVVPEGSGLKLDTGNAGALTIEVDGNQVRALGGSGDVVRDVSLDAGALIQR
ncbi:MAG: helix-turn-helix domain-containing protein [Rhodospirillaceae bacterium]|nr:helix-turn-helix domain-containing protein [Rhodospirillaceae bacterium]